MDKRDKLISFYRESGMVATLQALGSKAREKAWQSVERILVKRGISLPKRRSFQEDWIAMEFGIFNGGRVAAPSSIFTESESTFIVSAAEAICEGRFAILGSGQMHFRDAIPWHADAISCYTWPAEYFEDIAADIGSQEYFDGSRDIKYPWELSRMQFLITLGQAYWLTGNRHYYESFVAISTDWIEKNPVKIGCNWACPMDVAIRGANWCAAALLFKECIVEDPRFSEKLYEQVLSTGRFIFGHLECDLGGHGNNHYLANLAGLLIIGIMLKNIVPESVRWLATAIAGLEKEIQWQVNDDGGGFEGSLSYHRLSTEILLLCAIVLEQNGISFSVKYKQRLENMCQFTRSYIKPDGMAPVVGDADDGRFLILGGFGNMDMRDHRHILAAAGIFFNRCDFYEAAGSACLDGKWLFGKRRPEGTEAVPNPSLAVYPETGIIRYLKDGVYILIKCGPLGIRGAGSHDHNDQLSFEMNIDGKDIIVDSGSFTYTRDRSLRQQYRSVSAHNVTQYEEHEQNIIKNESLQDLFCMYSHNSGEILELRETSQGFVFSGRMKQGESNVVLYRTITLDTSKRIIRISDVLEGASQDSRSRTRLHLSQEVAGLELQGVQAVLKTGSGYITVEASNSISMERCSISPSYGVAYESSVIQWLGCHSSHAAISY